MDSDVERIKDRVSINDVVGQYVQLRRAGRNFTAKCPFHREKTPSFFVSPERGTYICFGCGEKGDIFSFVQKMDGIDFPTSLRQLAERAGITLHRGLTSVESVVRSKEENEILRDVCEEAAKFFVLKLNERSDVQEYLRSRGVKKETATVWRLGYAPASWEELSRHLIVAGFAHEKIVEAGLAVRSEKKQGQIFDRFRGRIMFPIFDSGGKVIAFSGRFFSAKGGSASLGEVDAAKYINSPETALFKKSRTLYGFDRARAAIRKMDCILLVEGQFDLILAHQSGMPYAVALSGTALTQEHLSLLGRFSKRLVLALDADAAGLRAGLRSAVLALAVGFDVKVPTFPDGKDPADLARENPELLKAAVRTSKTAVEFFLDSFRQNARDERAYKKQVEEQVLPLVATMQSKIDQEHFSRIIASRLSVSEAAVLAEVARRPKLEYLEDTLPDISVPTVPEPAIITPNDEKAGMLIFYFNPKSQIRARLEEIIGAERVRELTEALTSEAERLRFKFENELGEHTTENLIADDMLSDIKRQKDKENLKMKFS